MKLKEEFKIRYTYICITKSDFSIWWITFVAGINIHWFDFFVAGMPTIHISPGFLFQGKSAHPSHHLIITYHLYSYKAGMSNMFRFTPNRQCEKKGFRVHACYVDFFFTFHHLVLIHVSGQYSSKGFPHAPFLSPQPIYILIWSTNTFWFDQQIYFDLIIKFILIWSTHIFWFYQQTCVILWQGRI